MLSCQVISRAPDSIDFCFSRSTGLISTRWMLSAWYSGGKTRSARSASAIMVPRPGPSSISRNSGGEPIAFQTEAAHSPSNSPNIWLTSGAVVKSPSRPSGSRDT